MCERNVGLTQLLYVFYLSLTNTRMLLVSADGIALEMQINSSTDRIFVNVFLLAILFFLYSFITNKES